MNNIKENLDQFLKGWTLDQLNGHGLIDAMREIELKKQEQEKQGVENE